MSGILDLKISRTNRMRSWTKDVIGSWREGYDIGFLCRESWWWIFPEYEEYVRLCNFSQARFIDPKESPYA